MVDSNAKTIQQQLGMAFGLWINDLKSPERKPGKVCASKSAKTRLLHRGNVERYHAQRNHFWPTEEETHVRLERSISRLCRGQQIVKNALRWEDPYVGTGRTQRRLVMAWSGLEMIISDLAKSVKLERIDHFVSKLKQHDILAGYEPIQFTTSHVKLKEYGEIVNGQLDIIDFLDISNKETKGVFTRFFHERDTFLKPYEGLVIAKSLRHMIAHGALSSSKVHEWGLRPLFNRLTTEIGQITVLTFETLNGV